MDENKIDMNDSTPIVLSQWQTCVEMSNILSQRRDAMNSTFITLNLGVLAAISFVWSMKTLVLEIAGIAVCILWIWMIHSFKKLNTEKFKVIHKMEEELPVAPFKDEWEALEKVKYHDETKIEMCLPLLFAIMYVFIPLYILFSR